MKTQAIIYHNPRCSKSREALALLQARGIEPNIIEYLQTPPSAPELKRILKLLGLSARQLLRTQEPDYKTNRLDNENLSEAQILSLMVKHPKLIERPIVLANSKAALGRPPERILAIL